MNPSIKMTLVLLASTTLLALVFGSMSVVTAARQTDVAPGVTDQRGEPVYRAADAIEGNSLPLIPPVGSVTAITDANTRFRVHDAEESSLDDFVGRAQRLETLDQRESASFSFAAVADMRYFAGPGHYDTPQYFRGAVEAIAAVGGGAFMISPGDIDPPGNVLWTISWSWSRIGTWGKSGVAEWVRVWRGECRAKWLPDDDVFI